MNGLNININLSNANEREFISDLITSILTNKDVNINLNFRSEDIDESLANKEKLYEIVSDKLKVSKEVFFKLLDLLDNSLDLDNSLTGIQKIKKQCINIRNSFDGMSNNEIEALLAAKNNLHRIIANKDLYRIHVNNGGIIEGSLDDFEGYFVTWIATRGTEFIINYLNYGPYFVMGYIHNNKISEYEYFNEGIYNAFYNIEENDETLYGDASSGETF